MKVISQKFTEKVELLLIGVFILYSMWFQYSFVVIDSLLSVLGLLMIAVFFLKNYVLNISLFKNLNIYFCFFTLSFLFGFIFSNNRSEFLRLSLQILKYFIPMMLIIDYVGYSENNYRCFMRILSFTGGLLSIFSLQNGTITNNNGVSIGELNANVLASYLNISVFAILILFEQAKFIEQVLLGTDFALCAIATFNSASRRGALVMVVLSLIYLYVFCRKSNKENAFRKFLLVLVALIAVLYVILNFSSLFDNSTLLKRLLGGGDVAQSDLLRKKYQNAAFEIFLKNPLFGGGLGAVGIAVGMHSHSLYYELLACTGIVGTILFVYFLLKNIYILYKKLKKKNQMINETTTLMTIAFIASIIVSGIQVTYIYDSFFYLMIGAFISTINILGEEK